LNHDARLTTQTKKRVANNGTAGDSSSIAFSGCESGDDVLTQALFVATANAISKCKPYFLDVDLRHNGIVSKSGINF
jgi:dTDP-4-amino-4,6-dideoxygalactose transaminase